MESQVGTSRRSLTAFMTSLTLVTLATALAGCGGSGGSSSPSSTTPVSTVTGGSGNTQSQTETATAQSSLNSLVAGDVVPSTASVASVRSQFATAYTTDSTNAQAALGLGMTDIAVSAGKVIDDVNTFSRAKHLTRAQTAAVSSITGVAQRAIAWRTKSLNSAATASVAKSTTTLPLTLTRSTLPLTDAEYNTLVADITALNGALTTDLSYIAEAANYSSIVFPVVGIYGAGTTTILDQGDIVAVEAALYVARAATSILLAYNVNYGSFDFTQPLSTAFAGKSDGQTVAPDEYLPASPFGTLNSNGKALFSSAKSDLTIASNLALTGITLVQKRTTTGHLIPNELLTAADYQAALTDVGIFKAALSSPYTDSSSGVTVNLNAWFSNPPASLRALEPTWHVRVYTDGSGNKAYGFRATASDYPDQTFGGLITSGSGTFLSTGYAGAVVSSQGFIISPSGGYWDTNDTISVLAVGGVSYDSNFYQDFFGS